MAWGLKKNYNVGHFVEGKRANKLFLQDKLGLIKDENAPVFFRPSRLDLVHQVNHLNLSSANVNS